LNRQPTFKNLVFSAYTAINTGASSYKKYSNHVSDAGFLPWAHKRRLGSERSESIMHSWLRANARQFAHLRLQVLEMHLLKDNPDGYPVVSRSHVFDPKGNFRAY
jgi:hypothetical protein